MKEQGVLDWDLSPHELKKAYMAAIKSPTKTTLYKV